MTRSSVRFLFLFVLALPPAIAKAQDSSPMPGLVRTDSTLREIGRPVDSVHRLSNKALDSVQKAFRHGTDSLQKAYGASMNKLQSEINRLNRKRDSLARFGLPTAPLVQKVDSMENIQKQKINELNGKIGKLKDKTLSGVSSLHLPPGAQNEISSLAKNINGFSLPDGLSQLSLNGLKVPITSISSFLNLPGGLASGTGVPSMQSLNLKTPAAPPLSQLNGQAGNYAKQLNSVSGMATEQGLEKGAISAAGQNAEMKSLLQEQTQIKDMGKQLSRLKDTKKLDSAALQQLKPAVNHFLGREKELQAAMDKVSKLKQKYSSVASLKDLPKRAPNPLKGRPWYERTIVGLNYFVQSKSYALVDLNPYVGWRFNKRLTATVGWCERIGISHWGLRTDRYDRVYGVRGSVSYMWTRGIVFKLAPEAVRAYVPTDLVLDTKHRDWVWGIYAGVRKGFPVYKILKGYSEVMYNFNQKPFENIYGDRVVFRFGFEATFKKPKPKKKA